MKKIKNKLYIPARKDGAFRQITTGKFERGITPRKRLKFWRGLLGALITGLIITPYLMGSDAQKYVESWVSALNQPKAEAQLKLVNYQRHWFTSDADLIISQAPLPQPITMHLKIHHGPVFFTGHSLRLGLAYVEGTVPASEASKNISALQMDGPIHLTALVPYYANREIQVSLPKTSLLDTPNKALYTLDPVHGQMNSDDILHFDIPVLTVTSIGGDELLKLSNGVLRILDKGQTFSLAARDVVLRNHNASIGNVIINGHAQASSRPRDKLEFNLDLRFETLSGMLAENAKNVGPFAFKLGVDGLNPDALKKIVEILRVVTIENSEITAARAADFQKNLVSVFNSDTHFTLSSELTTEAGNLRASFHGGFTPQKGKRLTDLADAFYTKGTISLPTDTMQLLSVFAENRPKHPLDPENPSAASKLDSAMPLVVNSLKKDANGYSTEIEIRDGLLQTSSPEKPLFKARKL